MSPQEFMDKIEWEGGLLSAIFDSGLGIDDLDDSDPELKDALREFMEAAAEPIARLDDALSRYEI